MCAFRWAPRAHELCFVFAVGNLHVCEFLTNLLMVAQHVCSYSARKPIKSETGCNLLQPCRFHAVILQKDGKELTKEEKQRLRKEKKQQKKGKEKKDDKAPQDSQKERSAAGSAVPAPPPPTQPAAQKGACNHLVFFIVSSCSHSEIQDSCVLQAPHLAAPVFELDFLVTFKKKEKKSAI